MSGLSRSPSFLSFLSSSLPVCPSHGRATVPVGPGDPDRLDASDAEDLQRMHKKVGKALCTGPGFLYLLIPTPCWLESAYLQSQTNGVLFVRYSTYPINMSRNLSFILLCCSFCEANRWALVDARQRSRLIGIEILEHDFVCVPACISVLLIEIEWFNMNSMHSLQLAII
jgi:hypothetical protein